MEFKSSNKIIKDINDLKCKHDYNHYKIKDLRTLPSFDGIAEFKSGTNDPNLGGINHGTRRFSLVPNFYKSNFQICVGDYLWLFDTAQDVVSRPLGVA